MSNATNFAPALQMTLLIISLGRSSDAVFVPTSPGYCIFVPQIGMHVLVGSFFPGCSWHNIDVYQNLFILFLWISWKCIMKNLLLPLMCCWPSSFLPTPEQSRSISLAKDRSHFFAYCGWQRSFVYVMYSPIYLLSTKHDVACWASMCAVSAVVCEDVRDAIGWVAFCDGLVFLSLVLCATVSCTRCRSWRAPLLMLPSGAPLVIVTVWSPWEVTVGTCRSWWGSVFDYFLLCGVPFGYRCNCGMVDCRGRNIFLLRCHSPCLEDVFQFLNGCKLWWCIVAFHILDCACE